MIYFLPATMNRESVAFLIDRDYLNAMFVRDETFVERD
jgi:hypothetical protein